VGFRQIIDYPLASLGAPFGSPNHTLSFFLALGTSGGEQKKETAEQALQSTELAEPLAEKTTGENGASCGIANGKKDTYLLLQSV
jgi:hypothetical protein